MIRIARFLRAEEGVALISVMMVIFIMTVMVAAMAIATMGESTLSFDSLRGQQALAVAEAGAHRALAELRRRVSENLDAQISAASQADPSNTETLVRDICQGAGSPPRKQIEIITRFASPDSYSIAPDQPVTPPWTLTGPSGDTAVLTIGSAGSPVQMLDAGTGAVLGDFYAVIAVRSSGAPAHCQFGAAVPENEILWFDYAILSVGRANNATRTVCLRSTGTDRCANWFPTATATPAGSHTLSGGAYNGWPVLIEKASYSRWALGLLNVGSVWLFTGTAINGPVHSNTEIRIAGNPVLSDVVTQVNPDMRFFNCGSPTTIPIPPSDPNGTLRTPGCDNTDPVGNPVFRSSVTGGVAPMSPPANAVPSRTSIGMTPPIGANATEADVRARTTDPEASHTPLRAGAYIMNNCGGPACGGIYVNGDINAMVLSTEGNMQVIRLTVNSDPDPSRRNMKITIDPATKAVTTCWPMDPATGNCSGPGGRAYGPNTFNGVIYTNGSILSTVDGTSRGLYGMVHREMRMTIAAEQEIRITADLVYEAPPAGPGHNPKNVLGLYAVNGNVTVHGEVAPGSSPSDNLYIDAVVLAPNGRYWVEGWNWLPEKGTIRTLGGSIQGTFGAFGGFMPNTGYGRLMTYDWRLRSNVSPPFFPLTETYTAVRYPNPAPVWVNGDPLYDRPQWEEMVGL